MFILINYALTVLAGQIERRLSQRGRPTLPGVAGVPNGGDVEAVPAPAGGSGRR